MAEEYFVGTKTSDRYPIWTRANVGEVFPDPVALATFDFAFQNESARAFTRAHNLILVTKTDHSLFAYAKYQYWPEIQ